VSTRNLKPFETLAPRANGNSSDSDSQLIESLKGGLIVSCQAPAEHPLRDPMVIARLADCAALGGAVAVRVNSPQDVRAVRERCILPVIGLHKMPMGYRNVITPTFAFARGLAEAGADIVAIDFTHESPGDPAELTKAIHLELGRLVMADVSTLDEGLAAWATGADFVGTTLAGYTQAQLPTPDEPNLNLLQNLAEAGVRVVAEGRYRSQQDLASAFSRGAWAVVVGGAITDPVAITSRLVQATPRAQLERR
jgi:N-acylglucosamine-6-phosphate 2-epimerase